MDSNQLNSLRYDVSNTNSFHTANGAPSFYSAEEPIGPRNQNLSEFEVNQVHASSAAASAAESVELTVVDYNTALASNPRMIQSMYLLVKSAGTDIHEAFQSEDITVTGGAAYCMYAEQDRRLPQMPTSDIDMVWWTPGRVDNGVINGIIPIFSKNIIASALNTQRAQTTLIEIIQPLHLSPIQHIAIQVSDPKHYPRAGPIINSNLHLSILIDGTYLIKNLCELSIHNGISSQRFNINHINLRRINLPPSVKFAQADPIYCDHTENSTEKIDKTRVPTIGRYVIQQLFAYKNLRIQANAETIPKSHIRLYRVLNFCRLGNQELIHFIDIILSRSVIAVITNLTDLIEIQDSYVAEVEKDLHILMGLQYPILFPITYTKLKNEQQLLNKKHEEQHQRRKGGFRKKRTVKRKKNKSKTKKRSTR
jgi:hypothetical protein